MNKTILMGRLTKDPEVNISRIKTVLQWQDTRWQ